MAAVYRHSNAHTGERAKRHALPPTSDKAALVSFVCVVAFAVAVVIWRASIVIGDAFAHITGVGQ